MAYYHVYTTTVECIGIKARLLLPIIVQSTTAVQYFPQKIANRQLVYLFPPKAQFVK